MINLRNVDKVGRLSHFLPIIAKRIKLGDNLKTIWVTILQSYKNMFLKYTFYTFFLNS